MVQIGPNDSTSWFVICSDLSYFFSKFYSDTQEMPNKSTVINSYCAVYMCHQRPSILIQR